MKLHVVLQGTGADKALVADVTGQRTIAIAPVEAQVLLKFLLFPEGLPTL